MSIPIAAVVARIADEVYGLVRDRLLDDLEPRLIEVQDRLQRVEDKLDQQLLSPLRSGLAFLRLGDIENATADLVRAVATEPYSAVAKLWLGVALHQQGKPDAALQELKDAAALNPFLLPRGSLRLPFPARSGTKHELRFPNKTLNGALPGKIRRRLRSLSTRHHENAFVKMCSVASGQLIVSWIRGHAWEYEVEGVISSLELTSGEIYWQRLISPHATTVVTPLYVLVRDESHTDTVAVVDPKSGIPVRILSCGYFDSVFGDIPPSAEQDEWLGSVSASLRPPHIVLSKMSKPLSGKRWGPDHEVLNESFVDEKEFGGRYGVRSVAVRVSNSWTHNHILAPPPPSAPFCDLWSTASIAVMDG